MTDWWKEVEQGVRCIRLIEQLLREEENLLKHLKEKGHPTKTSEFRIARMQYALGEISIQPNWKDYFPPRNIDEEQNND